MGPEITVEMWAAVVRDMIRDFVAEQNIRRYEHPDRYPAKRLPGEWDAMFVATGNIELGL